MTLEIIVSGLAGGFVGILILAAFDPRGQVADLDAITFIVGALAGVGINRLLRS